MAGEIECSTLRWARCLLSALSVCWAVGVSGVEPDGDGILEPGEDPQEELARAVQNPVASLISLPFQNNVNLDYGPLEKRQNVLNIQPVWPFQLTPKVNLITRTILPIVSQPGFAPGQDREDGLGDATFTAFFSPKDSGSWIWGAGPVVLLPTSTDNRLGAGEWGAGPSVVALTMRGPWVVGTLLSNVWSFTGEDDVNLLTWQPFINYNMDGGWYLVTSPLITANWEADDEWTVPLGGGFGRVFRIGKQPVNIQAQVFRNVESPDDLGPEWSIRTEFRLMFPK